MVRVFVFAVPGLIDGEVVSRKIKLVEAVYRVKYAFVVGPDLAQKVIGTGIPGFGVVTR